VDKTAEIYLSIPSEKQEKENSLLALTAPSTNKDDDDVRRGNSQFDCKVIAVENQSVQKKK
jgi:hypothetical protein